MGIRILPYFKPKKGWHVAGTNLETDSYVLPTASADTLGGVKVGPNLSIDANGVLSTPDGVDPSMIAGTELTTTSTHAYAVGDYFISSTGLLCKVTSAIAIDDTISIGTSAGDNAVSVTVGGELTEVNGKISKHSLMYSEEIPITISTFYTIPADGYVSVVCDDDSPSGYSDITLVDALNTGGNVRIQAEGGIGHISRNSLFVRKGSVILWGTTLSNTEKTRCVFNALY